MIIANTKERARRYGENNFSVGLVKLTKDEVETTDCIYKFKGYTQDVLRGYRDIEELYIQCDIPVGAYFKTIVPYLKHNAKIQIFD